MIARMRLRKWAGWRAVQLAGLSLLGVIAATFAAFSISGAQTTPTEGASGPYAVAVTPFTADTPFSSGQMINVVVPANGLFVSTSNVNIVECAAPNGVLPTLPLECDGNTIQGPTILPNTDGSINLESQGYGLYQVFSLPDSITLGESATNQVVCGNSAATECVLYIGENQGDFTAPHVFSQPFNVVANADDHGENPGDGSAPAVPLAPSATLSTVMASPTTVTADGTDQSIVTVTLLGTGNVPVPNKTVILSQGTGQSTIIPAATPNMTDANGVATFTVTDSHVETVTYTAEDSTDSPPVTVDAQATVDFEAPAVDAAKSTISSSLSPVPSGQSDTITVTLRDQASNPQPVAGQTVTLSGTGSVQITPQPATGTTNSSGEATFSATDAVGEVVTFTAVDTTANLTLTPIRVTFGTLVVSPSASTVAAAAPAAAVGTSTAIAGTSITVTLLTSGGSPVSGITVALAASSSTATLYTVTGGNDTAGSSIATDAKGVAMFAVTDTASETVKFTATDTTDSPNIVIGQTASVQFERSAASATASKVDVNGASTTTSVADGQTQTLVRVLLEDQFGNPVPGATVNLQVTGSAAVVPDPSGSTPPNTTNPVGSGQLQAGEADFLVDDEAAETVTITAVDTSASPAVTVTQTATIVYGPGPAYPYVPSSMVTASPNDPPADGTTPTTVSVTVTDEFGNLVSGQAVTLSALPAGNSAVITAVHPTTNASGVATFTATDATAEVVTFQASITVGGVSATLTSEGVVTFGNPPVPPPVAQFCSVVATPTTVPADGATSATISVLLYNGIGDAVPGKAVTLTPSGGDSTVTAVNGTTTNTGNALFTVTDTTAESVTYTAEDTTDGVNLPLLPVTVQFTATSGTTSTSTTTTSTTTTTSPTTTTTSPVGSSTTTTSTTAPGSTTSTTSASGASTAGDTTSDGSSGDSSGSGGGSSSLAFTGVSPLLFWFAGLGALMTVLGTLGRRRFKEAQ
jgi:Big-like domain-containing protein